MLKKYAAYFVAYLINNLDSLENIKRIVLYGSVAKEEATKDSDVDIFIEINKKTKIFIKKFVTKIRRIIEKFYNSREAALFKSNGIENKFNIKVGISKEWKELSREIASTGIVLYGPYNITELPTEIKHYIIIFWNNVGKNRGSFLNKIYGFKVKNKAYQGLLSKYSGKKLGKSCIMLPVEYKKEIFKLLKKHKVEAKALEIFS